MRLLAILALLLCSTLLSAPANAGSGITQKVIDSGERAGEKALDTIAAFKLLSQPKLCLSFQSYPMPQYFVVDISEIHDQRCGGDPDTVPFLMRLHVWRSGNVVSVLDPVDGSYYSPYDYLARRVEHPQD